MKKDVTYVDAAKFEAIISRKEGVTVDPKSWVKVSGAKGRNVYLPATKTISVVHISGFRMPEGTPGLVAPPKKNGNVTQHIDFHASEADILALFEMVLDHMLTLDPREGIRTGSSSAASSATGWSFQKKTEALTA